MTLSTGAIDAIETKSDTVVSLDEKLEEARHDGRPQPSQPLFEVRYSTRCHHCSRLLINSQQRFINLPSAINFEVIMQSAWKAVATTFQFSLLNGGPASMLYGGILAAFGASAIAMSLAEMASMDVFFVLVSKHC